MNALQIAARDKDRRDLHAPRLDRIAPARRRAGVSSGGTLGLGTPVAGKSSVIRASSGTPGIASPNVNPDNRGQECRDEADRMIWAARESGWSRVAHGRTR